MTTQFKPYMSILPESQKQLWQALAPIKTLGFTLYGGTAIALRLGHRNSVDFDFFSDKPLDRHALKTACPFLNDSTTLQDEENTWVVLVPVRGNGIATSDDEHVKVSYFGSIEFGRVGEPELTEDQVLRVASLTDLMATKLKTILQRAEAKDYRDIYAMVKVGVSLPQGLAAARELFGPNFQPSESLKALTYFGDGDLNTLTAQEKKTLVGAVKAVGYLPSVHLRAKHLD